MSARLLLCALTALTLVVAGATFEIGGNVSDVWQAPELLAPGLPYAGAVLLVLLLRELMYFLVGKVHGVKWSAPYLVPVPNLFGTLGAIHVLREIPPRKALFDMAAAAAFVGFAASVVLTAVGLSLSDTLDSAHMVSPSLAFGQPLAFQWLTAVVKPAALENGAAWHPLAFAGWTGMLVTALSLLPFGHLDGGHIAAAILGRHQVLLASAALAVLTGMGIAQSAPLWIVWVLIMLLVGQRHSASADTAPIGVARIIVGLAFAAVLVACFSVQPTGTYIR